MLLEGMRERYATVTQAMVEDGVGGWIGGAQIDDIEFDAALSTDLSTEALIGGAVTARRNYTFAIPIEVPLSLGGKFRRLSDRQLFRVTSVPSDMEPPKYSMFHDYQITAEAVTEGD